MEFRVLMPVDQIQARLRAMIAAVPAVTIAATVKVAHIGEREIKNQLRKTSHPKRTPTPSRPGQPPSLISGNLFRSVKVVGPTMVPGFVSAQVGPTMIYSRIQELGGNAGRHHAAHLPARPYVKPGVHIAIPQAEAVYINAWRGVVTSA